MKTFFERENYTLDDIRTLIQIQAEETLYLEFKGAGSLQKKEESTEKIAAQVSSFANSDGGVMIYGLKEKDGKAHVIEYIDTKIFPKEWLQNIIDAKIQRKISTLEIQQIENPENNFEAIYLIKIKPSPQLPHMTVQKRYFRRTSTGKIPMEEYEVREGYYRTGKTSLSLSIYAEAAQERHSHNGKPTEIVWSLPFTVHNSGEEIEKMYKLEVNYPSLIGDLGQKFNRRNNFVQREVRDSYTVTINNITPLFSGENDVIFHLDLMAKYVTFPSFNHAEIRYTLYFSSGTQKGVFKVGDLVSYKGRQVARDDISPSSRQ